MRSTATSSSEYFASLPADRREALEAVRDVIRANLDPGFEEGMSYGMIGWCVPHSIFPAGYHCNPRQPLPYASIASQKNYMAIYLMSLYGMPALESWFRAAWAKTGKKLDMGKCCIRFKKLEDLPLAVIGEAIRRVPVRAYVENYEAALAKMGRGAKARKGAKPSAGAAGKKAARKKAAKPTARSGATKKAGAKKPVPKKRKKKKTSAPRR